MDKRKGFTLIELLVVISIIALLLAILMPSLQRVKKQAQAVVCQSNLKQWGALFAMYTTENDGVFHPGLVDSTGNGTWMQIMRPYYYNDGSMRVCPSATKPACPIDWKESDGKSFVGSTTVAWGAFNQYVSLAWAKPGDYGSYGINEWICNPPRSISQVRGYPTADNWRRPDVKSAYEIPIFLDSMWMIGWPDNTDVPPAYEGAWDTASGDMNRYCVNRHQGGINGLFVDFSVRKIGLKQLWKLKWHRSFDVSMGPVESEWPDWMRQFPDQ